MEKRRFQQQSCSERAKLVPVSPCSYITESVFRTGAGPASDQRGRGTPAAAGFGHEQRSGRTGWFLPERQHHLVTLG